MTVSALGAEALQESIEAALAQGNFESLARRFFKNVTKAVDHAWTLAVGEDLRYPQVEGPRPPGTELVNWYLTKVQHATQRDRYISTRFFEVMTMTQPPRTLFSPSTLIRVFKDSLKPSTRPDKPARTIPVRS
jgi:hypothetical protein